MSDLCFDCAVDLASVTYDRCLECDEDVCDDCYSNHEFMCEGNPDDE